MTAVYLSVRDSLGHSLSHDFGALGGTYPDVGPALDAFNLYANVFHNLAVLVRKFPCPLPRAEFPQKLHHVIGKVSSECSRKHRRKKNLVTPSGGVGRVWVCSVSSVPSLHTSESGGVK